MQDRVKSSFTVKIQLQYYFYIFVQFGTPILSRENREGGPQRLSTHIRN